MLGLMVAGGIALIAAVFLTPLLRRWLVSRSIGQYIREDGPSMHRSKEGTPTMGGIALLVAIFVGYIVAHLATAVRMSASGMLVVGLAVSFGLIGFVDDWLKVHNKRNLGLNKRAKLISQVVVASLFALGAEKLAHMNTFLTYTRFNSTGVDLGTIGWIVWVMLIVVGSSNAVNLTDGLDGLAAGSLTLVFAVLSIIGYWQFRHFSIYRISSSLDLSLASVAFAGACVGFLWWNAAPARIFMGDTGSLALGSGLAGIAVMMNLQLLLPVLGGLFVIVTLSVVAQVISYKLFHRRILKMAPLHHHFELSGWPESTVIVRFWIMAGLFAALALGLFYADYLSITRLLSKT
ncbi:MAG: phospho-N-acetylmuramoyl-pentapeptide-transferase [Actinobacteria bacterium]|nr:phospho-N-acetylmuramoyl-pentapeptide-transferase [Actinomycetota bacterium]MCL5886591.1 phospho-N-acetylmuramoyl-pentapeptide-transferase [Actinomycetota bacterium]